MKRKTAFVCDRSGSVERVYAHGRRERISEITDLHPVVVNTGNLAEQAPSLAEAEVVFSTWGMPLLTDEQLALLPSLKAVFYAAGSVKRFAEPLLHRGIIVVSAWAANGVPVAEYALAQILLANKSYFRNVRQCAMPDGRRAAVKDMAGNFCETVAILGAGVIGSKLIELLKPFTLNVIVWDPFLSQERATELGVEKVGSLAEAFSRGLVVSNHLANVPETRGLLHGELYGLMRRNATFINTGRGATVVEADLARVLAERPDLIALLDVTDPEPPEDSSPFFSLPNILLTSHIAGSQGDEVVRMADYMIGEFLSWDRGDPLRYRVTEDMLATMA